MADRRSVFQDEGVRALARERFVCAADEVWRLQRGSEADCVFFQKAVNGGKRITDRGTRQGTWVFAPDGTLLGRINTRKIEDVRALLEASLTAFAALPETARRLPEGVELTPGHRWEDSCPADGLVLVRTARDLAPEGLAGARPSTWNRDFAWFSRAEIAEATRDLGVGDRRAWPLLARRLARFHLVDNVRGQTIPYADEEVERAHLVATVTARVGNALVLRLEGETLAVAGGPWLLGDNLWKPTQEHPHGIETRLRGRAVLDSDAGRFTSFELVAVGRRFGVTDNNARWREPEASRLAFALTLAPPEPRVAPTFVALYDADWIEPPAIGTWNESPEECGLEQD